MVIDSAKNSLAGIESFGGFTFEIVDFDTFIDLFHNKSTPILNLGWPVCTDWLSAQNIEFAVCTLDANPCYSGIVFDEQLRLKIFHFRQNDVPEMIRNLIGESICGMYSSGNRSLESIYATIFENLGLVQVDLQQMISEEVNPLDQSKKGIHLLVDFPNHKVYMAFGPKSFYYDKFTNTGVMGLDYDVPVEEDLSFLTVNSKKFIEI